MLLRFPQPVPPCKKSKIPVPFFSACSALQKLKMLTPFFPAVPTCKKGKCHSHFPCLLRFAKIENTGPVSPACSGLQKN